MFQIRFNFEDGFLLHYNDCVMLLILQNWSHLVEITLNTTSDMRSSFSDETIENIIQQSRLEKEKVVRLFLEGMLKRKKIKDKRQWVQIIETMLIELMDRLYSFNDTVKKNSSISYLHGVINNQLKSTLNMIEDFFEDYFNYDEKAPFVYIDNSLNELMKKIELVQELVRPFTPYIHSLADILSKNMKKFCTEKKLNASYREILYQTELLEKLLSNEVLSSENLINEVLFYFNYNDHDYINYLKEKLTLLIESFSTPKEKISFLRLNQKNLNQFPSRLNTYLNAVAPPLHEQISHWIKEEINFFSMDNPEEIIQNVNDEKVLVHIPFRGSEIYLLHKAFVDSGGAPTETYKSLLEKTSGHLSNKNQKGFSTESLQKASDKVNPESKENVKRFLQKMIRNIDSYD